MCDTDAENVAPGSGGRIGGPLSAKKLKASKTNSSSPEAQHHHNSASSVAAAAAAARKFNRGSGGCSAKISAKQLQQQQNQGPDSQFSKLIFHSSLIKSVLNSRNMLYSLCLISLEFCLFVDDDATSMEDFAARSRSGTQSSIRSNQSGGPSCNASGGGRDGMGTGSTLSPRHSVSSTSSAGSTAKGPAMGSERDSQSSMSTAGGREKSGKSAGFAKLARLLTNQTTKSEKSDKLAPPTSHYVYGRCVGGSISEESSTHEA